MSIRFVINAAAKTTNIDTKYCPSHPSQKTSAQPVFYPQPANDHPKRGKGISSGLKYSKEQDFFIVYCRLVINMDWDQVEHEFEARFGHRTRRGLICRCSEIRRKWDLSEATSDAIDPEKDKVTVLNRALHLPMESLIDIGFVHWNDWLKLYMAAGPLT
jgi:hypothetical protein